MLTPRSKRRSCASKWKSATAARSVSAMRSALSGGQFSSSTPNSSPPSRASVSPLAKPSLQHRADFAQQRVARRVARRVVDLLEPVEVEEEHRVAPVERRRVGQRAREAMLELAAVGKAGERVVTRLMRQLRREAAVVGDVVEHEHRADDRAVAIADRRGGRVDVDGRAVTPHEDRVAAPLDRRCLAQQRRHRVDADAAPPVRVLDESGTPLPSGSPIAVVAAPAGQRLRRRIQGLDAAVEVGGDHALRDRPERDLRAIALGEQLRLERLRSRGASGATWRRRAAPAASPSAPARPRGWSACAATPRPACSRKPPRAASGVGSRHRCERGSGASSSRRVSPAWMRTCRSRRLHR